jgi:hypothetical protein
MKKLRTTFFTMSFLKKAIKSPPCIVIRTGRLGDEMARFGGGEEIAEIRFFPIRDPFCVRLSASVTKAGLIVCTIHTRVEIRPALVTFIRSRDESFDLDFSPTMMTVHTSCNPGPQSYASTVLYQGLPEK